MHRSNCTIAILKMATVTYPETQALTQVHGVGSLTAVTYVLTLGSKERFQRSRDVGCYLGLRPKRSQSGDRDPQPRRATSTYVLCWSSVPTMCSVHMGEIRPCDSGVCTWPRAEASSPAIGPSSPSPASWQYCFIASGSPRSHTS